MGRGLKAIKKCACDTNLVHGVAAFPVVGGWVSQSDPVHDGVSGRTGAIKVRPKVSPYAADYGSITAGTLPSWSVGSKTNFDLVIARGGPNSDFVWGEQRHVLCSRAFYEDGVQKSVNYLFGGHAHSTSSDLSFATWFQVPVAEDGPSGQWWFAEKGPPENDWKSYDPPNFFVHNHAAIRGSSLCSFPELPYTYKIPRPRAFYLGKRFFVWCGYGTSDVGAIGGNEWMFARYDNTAAEPGEGWYIPPEPSAGDYETVRFYLHRPSFRCFLQSADEAPGEPDEPWCIAWDWQTRHFGTGRWLNEDGMSLESRIEHSVVAPIGLGPAPNIVCYQHIQGRDIAIFRSSWDYDANLKSDDYWLWDGDSITLLSDTPTFVTLDAEGNIIYGSSGFVRKLGDSGWVQHAPRSYVSPVPSTQNFWEVTGEDPPEGWEQPPSDYPTDLREHSEHFQILLNRDWIQLRGFGGDLSFATSNVNNVSGYRMANSANSRLRQCGGVDTAPIGGWSLSHDGEVRIPHIQPMTPYAGLASYWEPTPLVSDTLHRMHARMYTDQDLSAWSHTNAGSDEGGWPVYDAPFPSHWVLPPFAEYLPHKEFQEDVSHFQRTLRDSFVSVTCTEDLDIVGDCACGCGQIPVSY